MSTVNNYLVTFTEVSTMGFTAKATWPVGSGSYAMNRGEVDTYWYVRQDGATYSAYTNKRYPRYQDLEATTTTSTTSTSTTTTTTTTAAPVFKYSAASANDACTGGLTMTNVILDNTGLCNSTTITCNEFLYEAAAITVWISYGGDVREATINDPNTSGEATFVAACGLCSALTTTTTTTTTAAPLNSITYGFDASDPDQACTNYEINVHVTKYNAGNAASANGVTIWNNSDGTGTPTNGYYARGGNVWYSTSGVLGSEAVCYGGTTTTTTSTTTTTTTTTTAPTYISYPADKYVCAGVNCGAIESSATIAFTSGFTPIVGKWYSALTPDGYAYELTSITPAVGEGLIMQESSFNTCGLACSI